MNPIHIVLAVIGFMAWAGHQHLATIAGHPVTLLQGIVGLIALTIVTAILLVIRSLYVEVYRPAVGHA